MNITINITKIILISLLTLLLPAGCVLSGQTGPVDSVTSATTAPETPEESGLSENPAQPPPPPPYQAFTFLFFSDTQPDPETMDQSTTRELIIQAIMREDELTGVIFGGDTVDDGGDEIQWRDFSYPFSSDLSRFITAAVAGNHDSNRLLVEQFDYPAQAPTLPGEGFFYSISIGSVFFVMLDSNIMGAANQRDIDWLRSELQSETAGQADWRIAVMHHPMWSVNDNPRDIRRADTMREFFLPIMEEYDVGLILCGHQHVYSRTMPMSGDTAAPDGSGIVQVMAASGDKATYTIGERDYVIADDVAPNYLVLNIDADSITITAFDGYHMEIDRFIMHNS